MSPPRKPGSSLHTVAAAPTNRSRNRRGGDCCGRGHEQRGGVRCRGATSSQSDARIGAVDRQQDGSERGRPTGSSPTIPAPLTALIGRASELEAVTDALRRARLVTLTGPGGVGKTRMAVELGRRQARQRADGVWLVDLASVAASEDVAAQTARVLDIRDAAGSATTDVLRRYLIDRDVLIVLDNCEHVLDACAELVTTLLGACSNLRILATSREPLAITGEAVWRLKPLLPEDAYRLFLERALDRCAAHDETRIAVS